MCRTAAHLARQHVPGNAAAQHEQNPGQHRPVGDRFPPSISAVAPRRLGKSGSIRLHKSSSIKVWGMPDRLAGRPGRSTGSSIGGEEGRRHPATPCQRAQPDLWSAFLDHPSFMVASAGATFASHSSLITLINQRTSAINLSPCLSAGHESTPNLFQTLVKARRGGDHRRLFPSAGPPGLPASRSSALQH